MKMLQHGLQLAAFQCRFLSTIYISIALYFNSFHLSNAGTFNVHIFQPLFFNYMRGEERCMLLRCMLPGPHDRSALPAVLCLSYCLTQVLYVIK
jgi:hypothetical protein